MVDPPGVGMPRIRLEDYRDVVGDPVIEDLLSLARPLRGLTIQHINSTRVGGGVAELLSRLVPLLNEVGLHARWDVVEGPPEFFRVTKSIHNALQGHMEEHVSREDLDLYLEVNRDAATRQIPPEGDVIVIHDPQPAAMRHFWNVGARRLVWRCHIDASSPEPRVWEFVRRHVTGYHAAVFSAPRFAQVLPIPQYISAPSIDPLSPKNEDMSQKDVEAILGRFGVDPRRPRIVQISRFDRFKDPKGVVDAYRLVKQAIDCQLVLAGGGATDDPEGAQVLAEVREAAGSDPDIFILDLPPFSDVEVNALQRSADVVLQKSLKEGFGLTVSEGLWKGRPVVAGAAGGIPLQIIDGINGYLVHTVEGAAFRIRTLLCHPDLARRMGSIGREYVRSNFLVTRDLRDWLLLLHLLKAGTRSVDLASGA